MRCRWAPQFMAPLMHFGQTSKFSLGRVLRLRLHLPGDGRVVVNVETDARAEGGDSGGPVIDLDGRLIGLVVARAIYLPRSYFVHLQEAVTIHQGRVPIK